MKTPQECVFEVFVNDNQSDSYALTAAQTKAMQAIKLFIDHLPGTGKWIPVTERLPDDDSFVLVWCNGAVRPSIARYWKRGSFEHASLGMFLNNVTHWQPLPEKP